MKTVLRLTFESMHHICWAYLPFFMGNHSIILYQIQYPLFEQFSMCIYACWVKIAKKSLKITKLSIFLDILLFWWFRRQYLIFIELRRKISAKETNENFPLFTVFLLHFFLIQLTSFPLNIMEVKSENSKKYSFPFSVWKD